MKIYWNGLDLVVLAVFGGLLMLCGIWLAIAYIAACIKEKRKKK